MINLEKDLKEFESSLEVCESLLEARSLIESLIEVDQDMKDLLEEVASKNGLSFNDLIDMLVVNLSELEIHNEEIDFNTLKFIVKLSAVSLNDKSSVVDLVSFLKDDFVNYEDNFKATELRALRQDELLTQIA